MKKVYLGGPIKGLTWEQATGWRDYAAEQLDPIWGLSPLRIENGLTPFGSEGPGIMPFEDRFKRDYDDVMTCDGIIFNMFNARRKSVGTTCEIAWSYTRAIPTALVIEQDNPNYDFFLLQCVKSNPNGVIVGALDEAIIHMKVILGA